jgi:hypothetical protein
MNSESAIIKSKELRQRLDTVLQDVKALSDELKAMPEELNIDKHEAIAQCIISRRDLESAIMRQGMVLKAVGRANPYPESYNPANTQVEPTADGLKL